MIYLELFLQFFKIGILAFGGGYVVLPLIGEFIVNEMAWISQKELMDIVTISQMTPGPIAINAATFIGMKLGSIPGSVIATFGLVAPSAMILLPLSKLIFSGKKVDILEKILVGLKPAATALIAAVFINLFISSIFVGDRISFKSINIVAVISFVMAVILHKNGASVMKIIGIAAVIGFIGQFLISLGI
ncbi:MAG: chromate transporter [Finegoldia sp.]|nr:chromate transporter [Finegoldia sp.]